MKRNTVTFAIFLLFFQAVLLAILRWDTADTPRLSGELIFSDWDGDMPQSVLDAFSMEFGVKVKYLPYESQETMIDRIREGERVDVLILESRFIPLMRDENLLTPIDYQQVGNFKNISPSFRGLVYDPYNTYSIPFNWGTTALVVRPDLVDSPITRWADLWDPRYAGRVAIWRGQQREVIGLALRSLGFSANSEDPAELQAALERLIRLKPGVILLDDNDIDALAELAASGQVVAAMGYAGDVFAGQMLNPDISYVYPQEGALLWGDNFVIPATNPNPYTASIFMNFLLLPEISAQIANENHYATANEAAYALIDPEVRDNPIIFPDSGALKGMEIITALSPEGQALYDHIWELFLAAEPVR